MIDYSIFHARKMTNNKSSKIMEIWQTVLNTDSSFEFLHNLVKQGELTVSHLGSFLSFLKVLLSLAEFGQIEGGNLLSLLNLLLVCLDLLLKLASQLSHTILVLLIFICLELKLLDATFSLLEALVGFSSFSLDRSQFNLELSNARFKFCHGISAALSSNFISISQSHLKFGNLGLKSTFAFLLGAGVILFSPQFISETSSINHCPFRLLFRVFGLGEHVINFSMHGMDSRLKATLVRGSLGINGGHVIDRTTCLNQFHISLFLATISRVKQSPSLLKFTLEGTSTSLS